MPLSLLYLIQGGNPSLKETNILPESHDLHAALTPTISTQSILCYSALGKQILLNEQQTRQKTQSN